MESEIKYVTVSNAKALVVLSLFTEGLEDDDSEPLEAKNTEVM